MFQVHFIDVRHFIIVILFCLFVSVTPVLSQSTGFTYQGRLNDNNLPANGNYDFEFKLFTALTGGSQDGVTNQRLNVVVSNGTFNMLLDFGAGAFPGADRFLEISVRPTGAGSFTTLTPRQQVTLTPYAIKSSSADQADFAINANNAQNAVNSTQLGGVAANQFVQTGDSRLSDARIPLPNSTNYIQNGTTEQTTSNFNISGNGVIGGTLRGNVISATTQFNIGNNRILSNLGTSNLFAGVNAGNANTIGTSNSFIGQGAGGSNLDGNRNTFFGNLAGAANTTGSNNTIFGANANVGLNNLTNASALGFRAFVESNDSLVLGSVNGKNGAATDTNVGIGTTSPNTPLDMEAELPLDPNFINKPNLRITNYGRFPYISSRSSRGTRSSPSATTSDDILLIIGAEGYTGSSFTNIGAASIWFMPTENWNSNNNGTRMHFVTTSNGSNSRSTRMTINQDGNVGIGTGIVNVTPAQKLDVLGNIRVGPSGSIGCVEDRDGTVIAGQCSSDLRFKKNITPFGNVLNNFSKLRPVNFFWRTDEFPDKQFGKSESFGLIAQEVEQIFPELVSTDEQGYKVVNYSKLPLLTIQAVKELKTENDTLKQQLQQQQAQIDELKKFVYCKPTKAKKRKAKKGAK